MVRWRYEDRFGVMREGEFQTFTDYGGTDVTYHFRRDDGTLDLVSGSRLKEAKPIPTTTTCEFCGIPQRLVFNRTVPEMDKVGHEYSICQQCNNEYEHDPEKFIQEKTTD